MIVRRSPMPLRVEPNLLDRLIGWMDPSRGLRRLGNRARLDVHLRKYEGASAGRRTDGWRTSSTSANAEILPALSKLRDRCRDLARNNAHAINAVEGIVANTVGAGILPRFSGEERAVHEAQQLWRESMATTAADSDGLENFYALQDLVLRTVMESGEALIRRRVRRPEDGLAVRLQLQVLEPDHLDTAKDGIADNGNLLIQGVEFDKIGRRRAYWLFQHHPGDRGFWGARSPESKRVDASEIIHVFRRKRPGQARGVPLGAAVILRARNWDEYEDAQLQKQLVAACYAAFETVSDDNPAAAANPTATAADEYPVDMLESGTVQRLTPGHEITFSDPPEVGELEAMASISLHAIAAGWQVPYELMTGDYSRTNYSSARMAWNEFGRRIEGWRWKLLVPQFCQRVFEWWLEIALLSGKLSSPVGVEWRAPRKELLDPTKEVPAIRASVRAGLQSLDQAIAEQGEDPDQVLADIAATNKKLDELGLTLDTDPRKVTLSGILQSTDVPDSELVPAKK
jgi:lambda family phage portal protein